jgi:uncharacterized repeat protein (TIGR01451 family)/MYXO-CTERM domain-containing protein
VFLLACAFVTEAFAAPKLRYQVDQAGDFVLIGNTLAQDCSVPAPIVGTVGNCGTNTADNAVDAFWRVDDPNPGDAKADISLTAADARTTAMLALPTGATVTYARLYWSAMSPDTSLGTTGTLTGPGGMDLAVTADATFSVLRGIRTWYQGTLDITQFVGTQGVGAYRFGGIKSFDFRNIKNDDPFIAWALVVFYALPSEPQRNLALFDGLDVVNELGSAAVDFSGFLVPNAGFDAKLGVIAYEGDNQFDGDQLVFNSATLSDALNPATNFFNGSHTRLGTAMSSVGDLPQLAGTPGTMSGVDLDVIDITAHVKAGDTAAHVEAKSNGNDSFSLGAFVTSISTLRPDLSTSDKKFENKTRTGGELPGDTIEYTITVTNTGNDSAVHSVLSDPLPQGVSFVPGSLRAQLDPQSATLSQLTDGKGDDAGEFEVASRTVTVRVGAGATGTVGGTLAPGESVVVRFSVTVDDDAVGLNVFNEATINAAGKNGNPPTDFKTTHAAFPVDECLTDKDCSSDKPICANTTPHPWLCTATPCTPSKEVCDGKDNNCDGQIDENTARDCSNCKGAGSMQCVDGKYADCSAPVVQSLDECPGAAPQSAPVSEAPGDTLSRRGKIIDGCGCGSSPSASGWLVALAALVVLLRRRRS